VIRSRQQSAFVGRQAQLALFEANLGYDPDDERPGFAGLAGGRLTPVAVLAASVVFGLWIGLVLVP